MRTKVYPIIVLLVIVFTGIIKVNGQKAGPVTDSVFMGSGYINEVYYSMSTGNKGAVNRKQWDIAFRASRMSASIITNDASNNNAIGLLGVELYSYPKSDTSGWLTVDTSGIKKWKNMVNSTTDWEDGAFCRNQKGHPDYGWGKYNAASHNVVGDSLFIIRLRDGSYKKLWIKTKFSAQNIFTIRYANLDGTDDKVANLDCKPYETKNFVGYSFSSHQLVDFEPAASSGWDILFARYMYTYPATSPNAGSLYPVTGVLSNYKTKVDVYKKVAPDYRKWNLATMDSTRSPIGWDWKYTDASFVFHVVDSSVYFIQDQNKNIHRLVFTDFVGSSTGRIKFTKELISAKGIEDIDKSGFNMAVYPNPARNIMNIVINPGFATAVEIGLYDISGRIVLYQLSDVQSDALITIKIPVTGIKSGVYIVRVKSGTNMITRKVIIQN